MCFAAAPLVLGLFSAGLGAYSSIQQGRANYVAQQMNAQIDLRNAAAVDKEKALTQEQAAIERRRLGERVRAERGDMVAKASSMGIDPGFGTPADLIGDTEQAYKIDLNILGRNETSALDRLNKEKADYLDAAKMGTLAAKSSLTSGSIGAASSLLDGVSSVSSRWIQPRSTTAPTGGGAFGLNDYNVLPVGGG